MRASNPDHFRIGNQTAFMAPTMREPFEFALVHGFAAFELFPDKKEEGAGWDIGDLTPAERLLLKEEARAHALELTVHAPWWANPLHAGGMELLLEHVDFAVAVGATLLNIHLYPEDGVELFARTVQPLLVKTKAAGIRLAIENTPETGPEECNRLFACWRQSPGLALDHVGLCFDLGHANLCAATRNDYLKFIDQLDPQVAIIHLHLHENYGDRDHHLPLFTGPAGQNSQGVELLLARLAARRFNGAVILEQWPQPPELLLSARERLLGFWSATTEPEAVGEPHPPPPHPAPTLGPTVAPGPALLSLLRQDEGRRSWREKLDGLLLYLKAKESGPWSERLILATIYLRFLATGAISCGEDGRHFRPNHHAKTSEAILSYLESHIAPDERSLLRKIQPYLPSFAAPFLRAEPLTRIREIAHRNDLPTDLKREIKHTLQNKLHRCASPEDLQISAGILARIRATPGLSPAFVREFAIFHQELEEFFNAVSLRDRLRNLGEELDATTAAQVESFLASTDASPGGDDRSLLKEVTQLREVLAKKSAALPFDATLHALRLADLGLEDYLFALLSGRIGPLEKAEFKPLLEQGLELLATIVTNLRLGMIEVEEGAILIAELQAWQRQPDYGDHEWLLRLKSTLERCRRVANGYNDWLLRVFAAKVEQLGRAFAVPEATIRTYCEGEIRAHLIFPFSNLVSLLLARIRTAAALPPFDVLVPGEASGTLLALDSLAQFEESGEAGATKVVLLLRTAHGEEEIPQAVSGIVLGQSLPHLSHLGVRARQQGVVLVTCQESDWLAAMAEKVTQPITLTADPSQVAIHPYREEPMILGAPMPTKPQIPLTLEKVADFRLLELAECTLANSGGKAFGVKKLVALTAEEGEPPFQVPASVVVPHGVLESCLARTPALLTAYRKLIDELPAVGSADLPAHLHRLRQLIEQISLPEDGRQVFARLRFAQATMVRSSANTEDLPELAGAGLYESVANVAGPGLFPAVKQVWSSLWSPRAVQSRAAAGLAAAEVSMAVLIQEMLTPDYAFVIHTVNPVSHRQNEAYIELAVGLGETIVAGATPGCPYRLSGDKISRQISLLAFADFSSALLPGEFGVTVRKRVDYSQQELSANPKALYALGQRLTAVGAMVEQAFGGPQDIEGAVVAGTIYLLQSRAQQGLPRHHPLLV